MGAFTDGDKGSWKWTLMIMQPEYVTQELLDRALKQMKKDLPALARLRFEAFEEGLSAQILHVGPFSEERPTTERLHHFIRDNGYTRRGRHREIYLSDVRRTAPEKLKTIIRQPIDRAR